MEFFIQCQVLPSWPRPAVGGHHQVLHLPHHLPMWSCQCLGPHLRQCLPVCLQVLPVSPVEAGHRFWSAPLLVCHSHGSGLLHRPVRARRLWSRYRLSTASRCLSPGSSTRTWFHLSVFLRWMWSRLHQSPRFCSKSNQRNGGKDRGAAQNVQVGHHQVGRIQMASSVKKSLKAACDCLGEQHRLKQRCTSWKMSKNCLCMESTFTMQRYS